MPLPPDTTVPTGALADPPATGPAEDVEVEEGAERRRSASASTLAADKEGKGVRECKDGPRSEKGHDLEKQGLQGDSPALEALPGDSDQTKIIVVNWKGEDDPACPLNWPNSRRLGITLVIAWIQFLSPLSSAMIAPANEQVAARFNITNDVVLAMVTSIFVLAYSVGSLFLGPMSELYGRVRVIQLANIFFLVFNLACGFAANTGQILAFRFLAGVGGAAPLGIGSGVLSDLWRAEERGTANAWYSLGPLLGPAIGPILGGWIVEKVPVDGWRWVFFSSTMFTALLQILGLFILRETYHPTLLQRQAQKLKKSMGLPSDSPLVRSVYEAEHGRKTPVQVFTYGLIRPFTMLGEEPILQVVCLYMAFTYGINYLALTTTTDIFQGVYGESVGIAGTNFVAQGVGFVACSQINGRLLDVVYRKLKARNGGVGRPEFRLVTMIPGSLFLPVGLILYGWGTRTHWIVVDIGGALIAAGMSCVFQAMLTYTIDCFPLYAASAASACAATRSLAGFGFPLFAPAMFDSLGYGVGCTVLAAFAVAIGCPAGPLLYKFGPAIRASSRHARK